MHGDAAVALVVGETLVDVVADEQGKTVERPGGSAANAAVALSRLARPVLLATSYAADAYGRMLADHLRANAVTLATDPHVVDRTSLARALVDADGAASYDFDVVWDLNPVHTTADVRVVHVCSLAPVLDPGAAAVTDLRERLAPTTTITYDINARPQLTGTAPDLLARVEGTIAGADLVKASDEDLAALWPGAREATVAERLLRLGAGNVVVTRGSGGAVWYSAAGAVEGRARPVDVVDTIGAGDSFGAGLLDALWEHLRSRLRRLTDGDREAALEHAARCAAVTVSRAGADPPRREELQL